MAIVYDEGFDSPNIERDPGYLFDMLELDRMTCDLSGAAVTRDSCVVVSPWDFKVHEQLRDAAKTFGKEGACPLLTNDEQAPLGDWNIWIVRKDLASCVFPKSKNC
jgi:hypothetical protein